jgi:hypothetical protein
MGWIEFCGKKIKILHKKGILLTYFYGNFFGATS